MARTAFFFFKLSHTGCCLTLCPHLQFSYLKALKHLHGLCVYVTREALLVGSLGLFRPPSSGAKGERDRALRQNDRK